jgi:arylsulfatase
MLLQWDESFDIGSDKEPGVNDADYQPPFTLTAKLNKLTPADIQRLEAGMKKAAAGRE